VSPPSEHTQPADITQRSVASFDAAPDDRLRDVLQALVRHVHAFVAEVRLTHDEWQTAIETLTETGRITSEQRQEFVLWSDTLGISMLVDALAHRLPPDATESTVLGPFYVPGSPLRAYGADISEHAAGTPAWISGRVLDAVTKKAIGGAELDVWQNGDDQMYAVQNPSAPEHHLRGRFTTSADGSFAFLGVRPVPYPIPDDGPVGRMLAATGRHPWRPGHFHLIARAHGYHTIVTHIFDSESDYLDSDAVFAVKPSLVRSFEQRSADDPEKPAAVDGPWCSLECDILLAPSSA